VLRPQDEQFRRNFRRLLADNLTGRFAAPQAARSPGRERAAPAARRASREAFGRPADPWEVASAIAFLASDYASCLISTVISVSGQHPRRRGA